MLLERAASPEPSEPLWAGGCGQHPRREPGHKLNLLSELWGSSFSIPSSAPGQKQGMSQRASGSAAAAVGCPGKGSDGRPGPNASVRPFSSSSRAGSSLQQPLARASRCSLQPLCTSDFALLVAPRQEGCVRGDPPPAPPAEDAPGAPGRIAEAGRGAAPKIAKYYLFFFKAEV